MSRDGKRRRGLTYEDRVLWTHVAQSIKPLLADVAPADDDSAENETEIVKAAVKHPPK